jgi:hypothetical protein
MKKKILGGIALLAIAAVAAWNVDLNSQSNELSAVSLANVEALAQESKPSSCTIFVCYIPCCYTKIGACSIPPECCSAMFEIDFYC